LDAHSGTLLAGTKKMKRHNPFPVLASYETIYAHAVEIPADSRQLHISGQVGVNERGELATGGFEGQCAQAIGNIETILGSAGMSLEHIVKVTIFLTRREDLRALREVRSKYLAVAPAVTVVLVAGLHDPDWLVEIEAIAAARP
jgi:2-iminobutanoate/2-iminopropanoate deaminase